MVISIKKSPRISRIASIFRSKLFHLHPAPLFQALDAGKACPCGVHDALKGNQAVAAFLNALGEQGKLVALSLV